MDQLEARTTRLIPTATEWRTIQEIARAARSGGLSGCGNENANACKILLGIEHGLSAAVALTEINVIEGNVAMGAVCQSALIHRRIPNAYIVTRFEDEVVEVRTSPRGDTPPMTFSLTWQQVQERRYHVTKNGTSKPAWIKNRRKMMLYRVITEMADVAFPEITLGMGYTPDELDEERSFEAMPPLEPSDVSSMFAKPESRTTEQAPPPPTKEEAAASTLRDAVATAVVPLPPPIAPANGQNPTTVLGYPIVEVESLDPGRLASLREQIAAHVLSLKNEGSLKATSDWSQFVRRYAGTAESIKTIENPAVLTQIRDAVKKLSEIARARTDPVHPAHAAVSTGESLLWMSKPTVDALYEKTMSATPFWGPTKPDQFPP
jgi:hypothetical protein